MKKAAGNTLKKIGNEKSYTKEFFEELCQKIGVEDRTEKRKVEQTIKMAAQEYLMTYARYQRERPSHTIEKELKKIVNYIDKAAATFAEVCTSSDYGEDIVDNIYDIISKKYPPLHGMLGEIKRKSDQFDIASPLSSLDLLWAMGEGIDRTLKNYKAKKTTPKSVALYNWTMVISATLEPIIGHKLEQSHYYKNNKKGEYISKNKISDSELLLSIISPLDPNVTISQIETIIKDTRQERYNTPWDDYFPWD